MRDNERPLLVGWAKRRVPTKTTETWIRWWAWGYAPFAHPTKFDLPDSQRLELAVQRRAFHADELGSARDIAAEAINLRAQIFPLEHLARVAQRQTHKMLAAITVRQVRHHRA